ncbi:MAG: hypothetical protein KDE54_01165 [Caldilineaceae bacterium]|nr:hypothetical protein [Caldilineaceae bacterium]
MLQRQTQTATFWRDQFEVAPDDLDFTYNLLLDAQAPRTLSDLSIALISEYVRKEDAKIQSELSKGELYQPRNHYEVGQKLVFPAMDFAVAEIVEVRTGQNPEHGEFKVISAKFADSDRVREFAAELASSHQLNNVNGDDFLSEDALLSPEEIYTLYQDEIDESILYALEESERSEDFVEVNGNWMLKDMLVDVHVGYLNIAEALIEVAGKPLGVKELMAELDLDANVSEAMQVLSMNHALSQDDRFDQVNVGAEKKWFLKRLEPADALEAPIILRPTQPIYNRALLSVELLQVEWELDDEWGESSLSSELPAIVPSTSLTLTYPHRRCGTLPLNGRTRNFFPVAEQGRSLITFIDGRWGTHIPGWVSHEGRYVTGLAKWMEDHALPVGAYLTLERTNNANEIVIDYRTRRAKREWAPTATADLDHLRLRFEMTKVMVACEYDEHLIVAESEPNATAQLRLLLNQNRVELTQIVDRLVPELVKLDPRGTVHAKSVYSAANMLRRCAPGPVFFALISNRRFQDVGGGFFALS